MKTTPIIGLEVHVELKTASKMFCGCSADHFHVEPNTHTCPVCLGLPGALPVPNKKACEWCIKLGLALGCEINKESFFERKNYFYPDLAKGYQITQLQKPFAINGKININGHDIRINRAHQEEDTGKSVHMNIDGEDSTLLDFNRSGVPLVEIVSEPDIQSPEEAKKYLNKLQQIIRYIGVSDADIEKGSMRCEPTINVKIEDDNGNTFYTPLVEVKNVASLTGVMNAIQYEIDRQIDQFEEDRIEKNSANKTTRGWDADKSQTFLQREKEGSADYRYFPEPDIPIIEFTDAQIEVLRSELPELPDQKAVRYQSALKLSEYDSRVLIEDRDYADFFESAIEEVSEPEFFKFVANIFIGPFKTFVQSSNSILDKEKLRKINFPELYKAVKDGSVSVNVARDIINEAFQRDSGSALELIKERGLIQVSDTSKIEELAKKVIADNPKAVQDYKKNPMSIGFMIGQLMKASGGSANPKLAKEVLEKLLQ